MVYITRAGHVTKAKQMWRYMAPHFKTCHSWHKCLTCRTGEFVEKQDV